MRQASSDFPGLAIPAGTVKITFPRRSDRQVDIRRLQVPELIRKKRDGEELSPEEIRNLISGFVAGEIPDYQVAAFLMAVYFRGMGNREVQCLTETMMRSGRLLNFADLPGPKVDKHSTGGVGDKTSLIIAPAAAACGLFVPMISGRGLGFSGGTLDKLESIPGFRIHLPVAEIQDIVGRHGLALVGQTGELVPADKLLYGLRDVTSTIDSIPLIVGSIMSKKLAEGLDGLVLDVKTGKGSFMKSLDRSVALARMLVDTGRLMDTGTVALITGMDQPLGHMVGNSLEVDEALDTLQGRGPVDLNHLCRHLTAHMLLLGGVVSYLEEGLQRYDQVISSGDALEKFRAVVECQGGDPRIVEDRSRLPRAAKTLCISAPRRGYLGSIDAAMVGMAGVLLGAGRQKVDDAIDPAVGLEVRKKTGDEVAGDEPVILLHYNRDTYVRRAAELCRAAIAVQEEPVAVDALIHQVIQ